VPVETENISEITGKTPAHQEPDADTREHLRTVALRTYSEQKSQTIDDSQIIQLLPMVYKIVHRTATYLRPPLSLEDLISAGIIGLLKAARDFDPSHQAEFKTYAYIRIKGAVLDELRNSSPLPTNVNKQIKLAIELSQKTTEQTGTSPTDEELADKLGITVNELYELLEHARAQQFVSIDSSENEQLPLGDILTEPRTNTPYSQLEQTELVEELTDAIQQLDSKRRQIILLYYYQHLTMKQIAEVLQITESRISQLHASALFNLSVRLRGWKDAR
jgi:RNA polymerase sigma factor for flagellar operon FliA